MNGHKAKELRALAGFKHKTWRRTPNDDRYRIAQHVKILDKVKYVSLQIWAKEQTKVFYKIFKRKYRRNEAAQL
jgi:hypothetical protein